MAEQSSEAAVLFADVSGSTKLYETAGNAVAHAAVESCVNVMRQKTLASNGRVIKTIGDEVMSAFQSADAAADAAIEMQLAISELPPVGNTTLGIRIGFNFGPVVERDGDVFGDAVNLASRLASVATKGQIITARDTVMMMSPMLKANTRAITTIQVKGKATEVDLYEILWQQSGEETALATRSETTMRPQAHARLKLTYLGQEIILDTDRNSLTLGRDKFADVTIVDRMGSRLHGKIEYRLGKFILADHSANGTFVTFENEPEIVLRREEVVLRASGSIAFGQSRKTATEVAEFSCE